ncbi:hypothetical protein [Mucilaginibacter lacusdianchii]|uniref:hypothetical protein n=1 Tax=Mucilaginibacter lacusdianchii TaxID=2684211 RepID=UPI00131B3A41|nr:hypothetical protein [Mucilaginibacter sp. JXJ CY 39]
MNKNIVRRLTIITSLGVFLISLLFNAVIIDYQGVRYVSSIDYFFMGSTAFLGGGLFEQIIWFANPLSLITIFYLLKDKPSARITSSTAAFLALSFLTWKKVLGAESGSMAKIISRELGYYLWLLSIMILTFGTNYYFINLKRR